MQFHNGLLRWMETAMVGAQYGTNAISLRQIFEIQEGESEDIHG